MVTNSITDITIIIIMLMMVILVKKFSEQHNDI